VEIDDFSAPLRLLAYRLEFTDPVDGSPRRFTSARRLSFPAS
jgi:tRNA pseudouridine32 synthase/23S rRNA pseudouridine746 synthase